MGTHGTDPDRDPNRDALHAERNAWNDQRIAAALVTLRAERERDWLRSMWVREIVFHRPYGYVGAEAEAEGLVTRALEAYRSDKTGNR